MGATKILVVAVMLSLLSNQAIATSVQQGGTNGDGTDLRNGRDGTDLGNGGDGVVQFKWAAKINGKPVYGEEIEKVYTYDLFKPNLHESDLNLFDQLRLTDALYYQNFSLRTEMRAILKDTLIPNNWKNSRYFQTTKCFENEDGYCEQAPGSRRPNIKFRSLYEAIADATAFHIEVLNKYNKELASDIIDRLKTLKFKPQSFLAPNEDTESNIDAENQYLDQFGQRRIGCAHRKSNDIVELNVACLSEKMSLSNSAALLIHEALYASLVKAGTAATFDASGRVRDVVNEIFAASDSNYKPDSKILNNFADAIFNSGAK